MTKIKNFKILAATFGMVAILGLVGINVSQNVNINKTASAGYYCNGGELNGSSCTIGRGQQKAYRCNGDDQLSGTECIKSTSTYYANEKTFQECPAGFTLNQDKCTKSATKSCPNGGEIDGDNCTKQPN